MKVVRYLLLACCLRVGRRLIPALAGSADRQGRKFTEEIMATVAQMTKDELREMIETIIEQKLSELLGDPDEGLPIRKTVRDRLLRQKQAVASGERGEPFEDVIRRLGLG